jgi:A/G-specific adenine glycosylase
MSIKPFSAEILTWFDQHGRKNLPWQKPRSAYRVWISEIMLQQTQVATVIAYFQNFIQRFPDLKTLAAAELDEILSLWSGLGYYSRARNLHRAAQIVQQQYNGKFPADLTLLQNLPGIGRSTAGAILALGLKQRAAILDGNVKRVLCRFHAIAGYPTHTQIAKQLWALAEQHTPQNRVADYTQAMMDLGALICTRAKPACVKCPLQKNCRAYQQNNPTQYPTKKARKILPVRALQMLLLCNKSGAVLLEKRPPSGIWGGLWSLPECAVDQDIAHHCKKNYFCRAQKQQAWPAFRHTFSHFQLDIIPVAIQIADWQPPVMDTSHLSWCDIRQLPDKGLAAPIKKLLHQLRERLARARSTAA